MTGWRRVLSTLALVVAVTVPAVLPPGVALSAAPATGSDVDEIAQVAALVRQYQAEARIPGLAVAVIRDGQVAYREGRGIDGDGAPVTPQTPFLIGSVSKPVTAVAVLRLVEAGRVALDEPVRRYVPWFRLADESAAERITVRHLLTHTSGMPEVVGRKDYTDRFDNAPGALTRAVRNLAKLRVAADPGTRHEYSGANYLVLGALVEAVSGQSFGGYLRQAVLDPLGTRQVATTADEAQAIGLPAGHRYHFGHPQRYDSPFDTSGVPYGYLTASLDDLTRFATAQLAGGRYGDTTLLSADTIQQMQTGQVSTGGSGRYGLGWRETNLKGPDARIVWHGGATPGYFSHLVLVPETKVGVVVLANAYSMAMDPLLVSAAFNIARILHAAPTVEAGPDPLLTGGLAGLVGLAALLLVALVWSVVRVVRRRHSGAVRDRRELARTVGWVVGCGGLAATSVWGVPALLGADGLGRVSLWMPDVAQVIGAVAGLSAAVALTRLAGLAVSGTRTPSLVLPQATTRRGGAEAVGRSAVEER